MTTAALGLIEKASGNTAWYPSYLAILRTMDTLASPDYMYYVSPQFIDANLGDDILSATGRRNFPTIQEAITAAEASGYSQLATVLVYPGNYNENLTINNSITICGVVRPSLQSMGSHARLVGNNTVQSPLIAINQPDNLTMAVTFINMYFLNAYNQQAVFIDKSYLLEFNSNKPNYGQYAAWVGFTDCQVRAQTNGDDNDWEHLIKCNGWCYLALTGTGIVTGRNAGGNKNGGVRNMIWMEGDSGALPDAKLSKLRIKNCDLYNDYLGAGTPSYISVGDGVSTVVRGTSFANSVLPFEDRTGGSTPYGLREGDIGDLNYSNKFGVSWIDFY